MYIPITSEINIEKGIVLKEIASGKLYQVGNRLSTNSEVHGDPIWELIDPKQPTAEPKTVRHLILTEKYLAEVDE